jgi:hypothetical protein
MLRHRQGDRTPDAAACAGDDNHLAFDHLASAHARS